MKVEINMKDNGNLDAYVYGAPYSDEYTNKFEVSLISLFARRDVIWK